MRPSKNQSVALGCRRNRLMLMASLAVLLMVIMAALPAPVQAASKITEILISDQADAGGVVSKHQDKFTPKTASINGTARITGAEKGQKVTADLIYGPENLKALASPEVGKIYDYSFDVNEIKGPVIDIVTSAGWRFAPAPFASQVKRTA